MMDKQNISNFAADLLEQIRQFQHDINNPICVISLSVGRLDMLRKTNSSPQIEKCYNEISSAVEQVTQILQGLAPLREKLEKMTT